MQSLNSDMFPSKVEFYDDLTAKWNELFLQFKKNAHTDITTKMYNLVVT